MLTVRYTEWDGTQEPRLDAGRVFAFLAEYLSYTDNLQEALDWLLRRGFDTADGHVAGLDELRDQVRRQIQSLYERYHLDRVLDRHRERFEGLLERERAAVERLADPGERKRRLAHLDAVSRSLSEAIRHLADGAVLDGGARGDLEALRGQLDQIRRVEEFRRQYGELFRGSEAADFETALELMDHLERLRAIEEGLASGELQDVDRAALAALLGGPAVRDLDALLRVTRLLEDAGYLRCTEGRLQLSARGARRLGELALREIYQGLARDRAGGHATGHRGGVERRPQESRSWQFGDPFDLDLAATLRESLQRGPGTPLTVRVEDFHVYERAHHTATSTVLLLDMSWSMSWEGRFAAAKKVALALESLIRSRYPHDDLAVVGFYTRARELPLRELPEVSWNTGDPFTNLQDGLRLAGELLRRRPNANRQILLVTDGQPTAYFSRGRLYCEWPLSHGGISARAARETLREVERITRSRITINTFMLDNSPPLRAFVERMTRINRGRAFFTRPDRLGEYLLLDYVARRRKKV